jgi:hypothetical protein
MCTRAPTSQIYTRVDGTEKLFYGFEPLILTMQNYTYTLSELKNIN